MYLPTESQRGFETALTNSIVNWKKQRINIDQRWAKNIVGGEGKERFVTDCELHHVGSWAAAAAPVQPNSVSSTQPPALLQGLPSAPQPLQDLYRHPTGKPSNQELPKVEYPIWEVWLHHLWVWYWCRHHPKIWYQQNLPWSYSVWFRIKNWICSG